VYEKALTSDNLPLATATATKVLEGMHVLSKGGIEETIALANKASPEAEAKDRRLRIIAQIIDGDLEKSRMYDMPLAPGEVQIKDELTRRLKEQTRE
jgi:hypothetical protein